MENAKSEKDIQFLLHITSKFSRERGMKCVAREETHLFMLNLRKHDIEDWFPIMQPFLSWHKYEE